MWDDLGDATGRVLFEGARTLALIWESAWTRGGGNAIASGKLKKLDETNVRARYIDAEFMESLTLAEIGPVFE